MIDGKEIYQRVISFSSEDTLHVICMFLFVIRFNFHRLYPILSYLSLTTKPLVALLNKINVKLPENLICLP